MSEYKNIALMSRSEKDAYFCGLRGTGRGKRITVNISPVLFDEINSRKVKSRAVIIRRLLYYGLAEQKRLETLGIKPGSSQQKQRAARLDAEAAAHIVQSTHYGTILGPVQQGE